VTSVYKKIEHTKERNMTRRAFIAAFAILPTFSLVAQAQALIGSNVTLPCDTWGSPFLIYPDVVDASHAAPYTRKYIESFFAAKSKHNISESMCFFSRNMYTYTDATLGWTFNSYDALQGVLQQYMPTWPAGSLSYPVRIIGGPQSAAVEFIDQAPLFGSEIRSFGSIDFQDGKIVRWIDYWDGNNWQPFSSYQALRTPQSQFPTEFKESLVGNHNASVKIISVATQLQAAFAKGDAAAAANLFSYEATLEDRTARTQIVSQADIQRYFSRVLSTAPFGNGSTLRHIVGGDSGGGFEWIAAATSPTAPSLSGYSIIELNSAAKITRISTIYDGGQISPSNLQSLTKLGLENR
jgi:hypothetical protein